MRGRTLNDSFVILDEAQNTTSEQMKMFLTRLGFNSKAVVTGDVTQIDLPIGKKSGLVEALEICGKIEGIGVVQFSDKDVVRHNLVQRIIRAYEEYEVEHPHRGNGQSDAEADQHENTAFVDAGRVIKTTVANDSEPAEKSAALRNPPLQAVSAERFCAS